MLLKSEVNGWEVQYGTGERIGTVKDLIVDTQAPRWPVKGLILSHGIGRRRHLLDVPTRDLEVDAHEKVVIRRGHTPLHEEGPGVSALDHLRLSSLEGAKVYTRDEELLGTAYDFAIATRPVGGWLVWRFLVRRPGLRSRRLRLGVGSIDHVSKGRIVLKGTRDTIPGAL